MRAFIFVYFCFSFAQAGFMSPFESSVDGLSLPNAHDISRNGDLSIVRGQRPYVDGNKKFVSSDPWSKLSTESQTFLHELFTSPAGGVPAFTDILIFKNGGKKELAGQMEAFEKMEKETGHPIQTLRIHFPWKDISNYQKACEDTLEALALMKAVTEDPNRRLFFHCTVGEDRTGYLSGLWRMLEQDWTRWQAFDEEMCPRGYGHGNPKKPWKVYSEIQNDLTPLYMEMADLIRQDTLTYKNLDKKACEHFQGFDAKNYNIKHYKCDPQSL